MGKWMRANLDEGASRALGAAAWIAELSFHGVVQLTRKGDELEIMGTNGYIMVLVRELCGFDEWPDGESIKFASSEHRAKSVAKLIKLACKNSTPCRICATVEEWEGGCVLQLEALTTGTFSIRARLNLDDGKPISLEKFENMPTDAHEGHVASSGKTWWHIGKLIAKVDMIPTTTAWTFHDCGPLHAYDLQRDDGKARIIAMPMKV